MIIRKKLISSLVGILFLNDLVLKMVSNTFSEVNIKNTVDIIEGQNNLTSKTSMT